MNFRINWLLIFVPILVLFKTFAARAESCTSTREYIATLEFLRAHQELAVAEPDARKIADQVVNGCTGSAKRFIRVTQMLLRSGVGGVDAAKTGIEFSAKSDQEAETFIEVFQKAFLTEYMDLDLASALKMARSLTTEFEGDTLKVRDDFQRILEFCTSSKSLDLPRPQCGAFAVRIAKRGQGFGGSVAPSFLEAYEFLKSEKGPGLATGTALKLAEELIGASPDAAQSFIQGYKYAVSPKGLGLPDREALNFAQQMATRSARPAQSSTRR